MQVSKTGFARPIYNNPPAPSGEIELTLNPSSELVNACWDEYNRISDHANIIEKSLTDKANGSSDGGLTIFHDRSSITIPMFLHAVENFSTYIFPPQNEMEIRQSLANNMLVYFANCTPSPGVLDAEHRPNPENADDDFYMLSMLLIKKADLKSATEQAKEFAQAHPAHTTHVNLVDNLIEIAVLGISEKMKGSSTDSGRYIHDNVRQIFKSKSDSQLNKTIDGFLSDVSSIVSSSSHSLESYKKLPVVNSAVISTVPFPDFTRSVSKSTLVAHDSLARLGLIREVIEPKGPAVEAWNDSVVYVASQAKKHKHLVLHCPKLDFDLMPYVLSTHKFQMELLKEMIQGIDPFSKVLIDDKQILPLFRQLDCQEDTANGFLSKLNDSFREGKRVDLNKLLKQFSLSVNPGVRHSVDFLCDLFELRSNGTEIKFYNPNTNMRLQSLLNECIEQNQKVFLFLGQDNGLPKLRELGFSEESLYVVRQIVGSGNLDPRKPFDFKEALIYAVLNNLFTIPMNTSIAIPVTDDFQKMIKRLGLDKTEEIKETTLPMLPKPIPLSTIVVSFKDGGDQQVLYPFKVYSGGGTPNINPVIIAA